MVFNPGYKYLPDISSLPGKYYAFLYKNDEIYVLSRESGGDLYSLPPGIPAGLEIDLPQYIGELDGVPCVAAAVAGSAGPAGSTEEIFSRVYDLYGKTDAQIFRAACLGYHLTHWIKNNRFCGKCGALMDLHERERARHCEKCGNTVYPRISPAIITAVVRDGKLLMARAARFRNRFYSVLAGFIEPGESAEEGLKREVMEETGIRVKNIKYFGSQPWPFPDSLMIAFTAQYESGEIAVDGREILDAGWFLPSEIPPGPGPMSVARKLIDWFVQSEGGGVL